MKDEIKEIIDNLEDAGFMYKRISPEEIEKILDYITNLQKENERLSKNQRYYKNGVFSLEYDKETMSDMIDDYKSRIDKAIEYIWSTKYEWGDLEEDNEDFDIDVYKLLNILEGE